MTGKDSHKKLKYLSNAYLPFLLFLVAIAQRLPRLGFDLINADGGLWHDRSLDFMKALSAHDWMGSFQTGHPGVPVLWLSGVSMTIYIMGTLLSRGKLEMLGELTSLPLNERLQEFPDLHFAAKLPLALASAIVVVFVYLLIKKMSNKRIAFVAGALVAVDPYYLAHSRILHLDALLSGFIVLSIICFILFLIENRMRYLIASGLLTGLAIATKSLAIILFPFFFIVVLLFHLFFKHQKRSYGFISLRLGLSGLFVVWLLIAVLTFVVIFPAMWVAPVQVLGSMARGLFKGATMPHAITGMVYNSNDISNSRWFYLSIIARNLTPITLPFLFVAMAFIFQRGRNDKKFEKFFQIILLLFTLFFVVVISLAAKKINRYSLPVFPVIDILAAFGIYRAIEILSAYMKNRFSNNRILRNLGNETKVITIVVFLIFVYSIYVFVYLSPHYFTYTNPVITGRIAGEAEDGGSGLRLAAIFLNQKEDSSNLVVACVSPEYFAPFFKGRTISLEQYEEGDSADYIVLHTAKTGRKPVQAKMLREEFSATVPEKVFDINGHKTVLIFRPTEDRKI